MRHLRLAAAVLLLLACGCSKGKEDGPIRVGVLQSYSGTMAVSGSSVRDAVLLAIEEVNAKGGVLGRKIEPVVVDARSDSTVYVKESERLIAEEKVAVVFGCWRSSDRKAIKPIFERHDHLLFYPVQYEGLEESPNIVYLGATPNQQIVPAVKWCLDNGRRKVFLVGSDYVFPRTANAIVRELLVALKGEVVGEEYVRNDGSNAGAVAAKIASAKADVILNTINGSPNTAFFHALRAAGVTPKTCPTMSFSIAEEELRSMGAAEMEGDYAAWNYFQSIDTPENKAFVAAFRARYGKDRVTDDPMEAGYFGVHLWAQAVADAGTADAREVRAQLAGASMKAPEGIVAIERENQHTWKTVRIGRIRSDGQFDIVWTSSKAVHPVTFPVLRPKAEWQKFLDEMFKGWGGRWANPNG